MHQMRVAEIVGLAEGEEEVVDRQAADKVHEEPRAQVVSRDQPRRQDHLLDAENVPNTVQYSTQRMHHLHMSEAS